MRLERPEGVEAAAATLLVDAAAARAIRSLAAHGIEVVLLKGSGLAFLYDADDLGGGSRTYDDVDLLVDPARRAEAGAVVERIGPGYRSRSTGLSPLEEVGHATTYLADDDPPIDLHHTLAGVGVDPGRAWAVLREATVDHVVAGCPTRVLDLPARAMHVALHFAQSGPGHEKPAEDLDRALERIDLDTWRAAAELASELEAVEAMAAALRWRGEAGRELADALGLPRQVSLALDIRRRTTSPLANALARVGEVPGAGAKVRLLTRLVVPTPANIRLTAPPRADGRPPSLLAGYASHWRRSVGDHRGGARELAAAAWRRRRPPAK